MRSWLLTALVAFGLGVVQAQDEPLLQLHGQPYSLGSVTLQMSASVGAPVYVFYGLDPLDPPLATNKGPFYVGSLANAVFVGSIPAGGRLEVAFQVPLLSPVLAGIPLVLQGFVPGALSNPATLPLDQPYCVPAAATVLAAASPQQGANFGDTHTVGDLNGDGHMDIVVGAWWQDVGGIDKAGAVHVFWGPSFQATTVLTSANPATFRAFGMNVCVADLDGDGVGDLIVGEGGGSPPAPDAVGSLNVFTGGMPFATAPSRIIDSFAVGIPTENFGRILAAGDLDGDDHRDLVVGVSGSALDSTGGEGHIEVFYGPDFVQGVKLFSPDPAAADHFGSRVGLGDVTGDGVDDLLEASGREDVGGVQNIGRAHVFDGPTLQPLFTLENPLPDGANSRFGNVVLGRDLDGDGVAEIVVTDQRDHVFVFWSPDHATYTTIHRAPPPGSSGTPSVSFGYFATIGDANGDGLPDIVVGEPFGERVHVALGPYWNTLHVLMEPVPQGGAEFGWGVSMADVDGDGRQELLVGSPLATVGTQPGAGRLVVYDLSD